MQVYAIISIKDHLIIGHIFIHFLYTCNILWGTCFSAVKAKDIHRMLLKHNLCHHELPVDMKEE